MRHTPVIGLEVHVQVKTRSKMFCGCPADVFGRKPNTATCPVCLGLPGAMPVPNAKAIEKTVLLAKSLGCKITRFSQFERKNYFYPDLPKGFQISQYAGPIGEGGQLKGISIRRVHLEEDTGRLVHESSATLVDFNRSGVPLIEIVSEPEFSDPAKVTEFLKELRTTIIYLGISDADMEKGSLRLEANVSLQEENNVKLPEYKVELKNINSFAFLEKAVRAEIARQTEVMKEGLSIPQETRGFDEKRGVTVLQRRKEEALDYRYLPEPDIPPITEKLFRGVRGKKTLSQVRKEYLSLGLSRQYAEVLIKRSDLAALFEGVRKKMPPKEAADVIVNKRFGSPRELGAEGIISAYQKQLGNEVISGEELSAIAEKVVLDNPAAVSDYAAGKENALQFLFGQLMRETQGKLAPKEGKDILKKKTNARAKTTSAKN
ncbi:MAG: Asp-tRNA(Asn)/Glu-tRNA(Gln) amidotransferase subunit GatB [Patescibacteria group bacterium]|nr:MAG: Asp-tRNA(Asn)/Glu-tRNA(Gln) amidotransferase subunit GatB [Patescibacteria group bacterium]